MLYPEGICGYWKMDFREGDPCHVTCNSKFGRLGQSNFALATQGKDSKLPLNSPAFTNSGS